MWRLCSERVSVMQTILQISSKGDLCGHNRDCGRMLFVLSWKIMYVLSVRPFLPKSIPLVVQLSALDSRPEHLLLCCCVCVCDHEIVQTIIVLYWCGCGYVPLIFGLSGTGICEYSIYICGKLHFSACG